MIPRMLQIADKKKMGKKNKRMAEKDKYIVGNMTVSINGLITMKCKKLVNARFLKHSATFRRCIVLT